MPTNDNQFTLVAVETSSIQSYIFGSNRLKENIGASYLVKQATEDWAYETIYKDITRKSNVKPKQYKPDEYEIDLDEKIIENVLDVEVIYAGGGNFVAMFKEKTTADAFTKTLSTKVLTEAPGLTLNIYQAKDKFDWDKDQLGQKVKELIEGLKTQRGTKRVSAPVLGLGVTMMCQSTAMPAVEIVEERDEAEPNKIRESYVSAQIAAKINNSQMATDWLNGQLSPGNGFRYPLDFDDMGRSRGDTSYLAIVHADGNGMGAIIGELGKELENRKYINNMRGLSRQIREISTKAMTVVLDLVRNRIVPDEENHKIKIIKSPAKSVEDIVLVGNNLPIRPIVFGGDDTTFVCDGRLGLELATLYLKAFQDAAIDEGLTLSACAGISIVKTHYPFARAYKLAEELCDSAKKFRKDKFENGGGALDWYFSAGGLYNDLEKMREREYEVKFHNGEEGNLTLRPVSLDEKKDSVICWDDIKRITRKFQGNKDEKKEVTEESDAGWGDKRNKVKALRDALREGQEAVTKFRTIYGQTLPEFAEFDLNGWATIDGELKCGYFDALELLDIYLPLQEIK